MIKKIINPWEWQENLGFVQANDVTDVQHTIYCAGQTSVDANGNPMHAENMAAQINQALDNVETVLRQAGAQLSNVVRLNYYTTDLKAFVAAEHLLAERLSKSGCKPASTLLGVVSLFHPDILVEIEATAVV